MGHQVDRNGQLVGLIDRLNKNPIGLPDSEQLRRILAILFSEQEAYIASRFPLHEASLTELARATSLPAGELEPLLDTMADKGLVMDLVYNGTTFYLLMPGLIGFFEFTFMKQRRDLPLEELAQLMHEYLFEDPERKMAAEMFGGKTVLTRALPYEEHIPVESVVTPYESAIRLVREAGYGAVGTCYCRHKKQHLQQSCDKGAPTESICISLGTAARFMVRRGFAREQSVEELLEVLKRARELNLTHITDNIRYKPSFICNCCSCCCELLGGLRQGYPQGVAKAGYTLAIDETTCVGCGVCRSTCNVGALALGREMPGRRGARPHVDPDTCLGCGACISACNTGSLFLEPSARPPVPLKRKHLFVSILREKRRLAPHLASRFKTKVLRVLGVR